jgi:hypothetical protein
LLEVVIRLGYRIIDTQFNAYAQAMTRVQVQEVEERRIATQRQIDALDRMGVKIDGQANAIQDLVSTIREAFLVRGGTR